jgi:hypothetical protein
MTRRDLIRELIAGCSDGQVVTVRVDWLRELLGGDDPKQADDPLEDLSVADLAKHYHRSEQTMRAWCKNGVFPGAYRSPDGYRVPRAALRRVRATRSAESLGSAEPRATSATKHLAVEAVP